MTGALKTILIVFVIIVGLGILLTISVNSAGGAIGGFGVIIMYACWAAIKAIRNYESENEESITDIHKLEKD